MLQAITTCAHACTRTSQTVQYNRMTDSSNAQEKRLARREELLANFSQNTQLLLRARMTTTLNAPLVVLRFSAFAHCVSKGCSNELSHLVSEVLHPLDNHVMPGVKYTKEARKIARRFAKQLRHASNDALEMAALTASRALSEAAQRHNEEYYEALHSINFEVYQK